MKFLQNLFNKPPQISRCIMRFNETEGESLEDAPKGLSDGESLDKIHQEFCDTVCHKPGVNLMATIKAENGLEPLVDWLHWQNNNAESMAFLTLMVDATRRGTKIWEQTGIKAFHDGGNPPDSSLDALGALTQILGMPIKLFFENKNGQLKVWDFEP